MMIGLVKGGEKTVRIERINIYQTTHKSNTQNLDDLFLVSPFSYCNVMYGFQLLIENDDNLYKCNNETMIGIDINVYKHSKEDENQLNEEEEENEDILINDFIEKVKIDDDFGSTSWINNSIYIDRDFLTGKYDEIYVILELGNKSVINDVYCYVSLDVFVTYEKRVLIWYNVLGYSVGCIFAPIIIVSTLWCIIIVFGFCWHYCGLKKNSNKPRFIGDYEISPSKIENDRENCNVCGHKRHHVGYGSCTQFVKNTHRACNCSIVCHSNGCHSNRTCNRQYTSIGGYTYTCKCRHCFCKNCVKQIECGCSLCYCKNCYKKVSIKNRCERSLTFIYSCFSLLFFCGIGGVVGYVVPKVTGNSDFRLSTTSFYEKLFHVGFWDLFALFGLCTAIVTLSFVVISSLLYCIVKLMSSFMICDCFIDNKYLFSLTEFHPNSRGNQSLGWISDWNEEPIDEGTSGHNNNNNTRIELPNVIVNEFGWNNSDPDPVKSPNAPLIDEQQQDSCKKVDVPDYLE